VGKRIVKKNLFASWRGRAQLHTAKQQEITAKNSKIDTGKTTGRNRKKQEGTSKVLTNSPFNNNSGTRMAGSIKK
jgi:hypothetical protein